jgi:transcriptional regulator with XRE-family HTH domain
MNKPANICGPVVARLRRKQSLTQVELQQRCNAAGWPVARSVLAKVEKQSRSVSDRELVALARALRVKVSLLLRNHAKS